jgi:hypothetical protein
MKFRPVKVAEILDTVIQQVAREAPGLFSDHEQKYGPVRINFKLERVLSENVKRLAQMRDDLLPKSIYTYRGCGEPGNPYGQGFTEPCV